MCSKQSAFTRPKPKKLIFRILLHFSKKNPRVEQIWDITSFCTDNKRITGWPHSTSCEIPCVYNFFHVFLSAIMNIFYFVNGNHLLNHNLNLKLNFPCLVQIPCVFIKFLKFPVYSLPGKIDNHIPCLPCAVATLKYITESWNTFNLVYCNQCEQTSTIF